MQHAPTSTNLSPQPNATKQVIALSFQMGCMLQNHQNRCEFYLICAWRYLAKQNKWMFLDHQDTCHGRAGSPERSVAAHAPLAAQAPMLRGWMPFPTAHSAGLTPTQPPTVENEICDMEWFELEHLKPIFGWELHGPGNIVPNGCGCKCVVSCGGWNSTVNHRYMLLHDIIRSGPATISQNHPPSSPKTWHHARCLKTRPQMWRWRRTTVMHVVWFQPVPLTHRSWHSFRSSHSSGKCAWACHESWRGWWINLTSCEYEFIFF